MTPLHHHHIGTGILAHHPSGPQHYIASLGDCMFVSCIELVTWPNECFVQGHFRNWPLHMQMSHTYVPTHATSQAPTDAHTHANSSSTCVTPKWSIPLDIRPSHALPLCACGTPMHLDPRDCVEGSTSVNRLGEVLSWIIWQVKHPFST
ncbi:hypothetical protein O181_049485 [Austropuccinia psidii MF-1]|uniref:Uncharacterized protein n=1 Tax=Austropuccinia psidii MF-1 TaxID=1389203 RepID=A0A9Q3HQ36_9BASI|nr:hypothetical protein [Austropuccinia psidii MF-1]